MIARRPSAANDPLSPAIRPTEDIWYSLSGSNPSSCRFPAVHPRYADVGPLLMDFSPSLPLAAIEVFGQLIEWSDLLVVGLLVILEGLLSIDNALVLGILAKRLPKDLRTRALSYGLIGAFVFRVIAIGTASFLLQWTIVKLLGGAYLLYIAIRHLAFESGEDDGKYILDAQGNPHIVDPKTGDYLELDRENVELEQRLPIGSSLVQDRPEDQMVDASADGPYCSTRGFSQAAFWRTVLVIELTDIAFAVDSILAAIALAGSREEKLWVVVVGGLLGVILMRFAAAAFIRLLERFPRFEISAYLLVAIIGLKLVADWGVNSDWSLDNQPTIAAAVGNRKEWFENLEDRRRDAVKRYDHWLEESWPLGSAAKHDEHDDSENGRPPHLLNFHEFRRPESIAFWVLMATAFGIGFLPERRSRTTS